MNKREVKQAALTAAADQIYSLLDASGADVLNRYGTDRPKVEKALRQLAEKLLMRAEPDRIIAPMGLNELEQLGREYTVAAQSKGAGHA